MSEITALTFMFFPFLLLVGLFAFAALLSHWEDDDK